MWENVGVMRNGTGLLWAARILSAWEQAALPAQSQASFELSNMVLTARLMAEAALLRRESRGAHFRSDFPEPSREWARHIVLAKGE
jgi:L-aspartate oxidase